VALSPSDLAAAVSGLSTIGAAASTVVPINQATQNPLANIGGGAGAAIVTSGLGGNGGGIGTSTLIYPADLAMYYFLMNIQTISSFSNIPAGVSLGGNTAGTLSSNGAIALPLPKRIMCDHVVTWEEKSLTELFTLGATESQLGKLTQSIFGATVNQFMVMMLRGPEFRELQFTWHFSPKTAEESATLRDIISKINASMAPDLSFADENAASVVWTLPQVFLNSFNYAGAMPSANVTPPSRNLSDWTYYMKPAVCAAARFDYTPQNVWASYAATKAPESVDITLIFKELYYWLNGDNFGPTTSVMGP